MNAASIVAMSTTRRVAGNLAWRLVPAAPFLIVLLIWLVLWEVFQPSKETLPPVRDVLSAIHDLAISGQLAQNVIASLGRLVAGSLLGIVTGVAAGFVVGLNRNVAELLNPLVVFFNAISGIIWLPLMITWLGIGTALAVFLIWNTVFFIVFQNTVLGVQLVPEVLEQGVRALGAGRMETLRSVTLPGALPYIITGIRSGLGFGWRALIAAELVGAASGLGTMIFDAAEYHRSDIIMLGCLIIGTIAIAMDRWLLLPVERCTVQRWGLVSDAEVRR
jgi:NitT/TauT family transport system permease protein/taurine transport system permease protein